MKQRKALVKPRGAFRQSRGVMHERNLRKPVHPATISTITQKGDRKKEKEKKIEQVSYQLAKKHPCPHTTPRSPRLSAPGRCAALRSEPLRGGHFVASCAGGGAFLRAGSLRARFCFFFFVFSFFFFSLSFFPSLRVTVGLRWPDAQASVGFFHAYSHEMGGTLLAVSLMHSIAS